MNALDEFRLALARGESQTVEFSSDASHSHILQTISAFANTRGGVIYVGVDERPEGSPTDKGVRISPVIMGAAAEAVDRIVSNLAQHFDDPLPKVSTSILADRGPNGPVIAITVSRHSGKDKIALLDLSIWSRRGKHNETIQARARPNRNSIRAQEADAIKFSEHASATVIRTKGGTESSTAAETEARDPEQTFSDKPAVDVSTDTESTASPKQVDSNGDGSEDNDVSISGSTAHRQIGTRAVFSREASDEELALNADEYAELIARLFAGASDRERMSFAIFGHWGRGKTYLAGRVIRSLGDATSKYATVSYSAWKYRTTPELWAYLFQQFLETGKKSRLFFATSAAFARYGPWPMLVALGCLLIALFSFSERAKLIVWVIQSVGIGTILYLAFVFVRFRSTAVRLRSLYSFSGHADKLGLQAAIGDDLRALLQAWIPRNVKSRKAWMPIICYVVLCLLISIKLWPRGDRSISLSILGDFAAQSNEYIAFAPFGTWLVIWIAGLAVFYSWSLITVNRVLLVVDDLDRCEPKQMLEIIESTMLILDDPEIHSRLQVMMLIDESAFRHALLIKYRYLTVNRQMGSEHIYNSQRIIRENQEKFFLVHLRLPPLSNDEIDAVAAKFAGQLRGKAAKSGPKGVEAAASGDDSPLVEDARKETDQSGAQPSSDFVIETVNWPIGDYEMRAIAGAIEQLAQIKERDSIGPRTIRCLLFRYQMARSILFKLGYTPDADQLARAIVNAYLGQKNKNAKEDWFVRSAVDQVS